MSLEERMKRKRAELLSKEKEAAGLYMKDVKEHQKNIETLQTHLPRIMADAKSPFLRYATFGGQAFRLTGTYKSEQAAYNERARLKRTHPEKMALVKWHDADGERTYAVYLTAHEWIGDFPDWYKRI